MRTRKPGERGGDRVSDLDRGRPEQLISGGQFRARKRCSFCGSAE